MKIPPSKVNIRPIASADRARIHEIVVAAGNFNSLEIETAMELVDESLLRGDESGYITIVAELTKVEGYACYGPTPLTDGVFDLYWIAVHPEAQGQGVGRDLIRYVEEGIRSRGGRMLLIETSSRKEYEATISFYKNSKYELAARIKNFYAVGDDKLVFSKELI